MVTDDHFVIEPSPLIVRVDALQLQISLLYVIKRLRDKTKILPVMSYFLTLKLFKSHTLFLHACFNR